MIKIKYLLQNTYKYVFCLLIMCLLGTAQSWASGPVIKYVTPGGHGLKGTSVHLNTPNTIDNAIDDVVNLLGQVVYTRTAANNNGDVLITIDNASLPEGIYLVKVVIGTNLYTQRVVIQK